EVGILFSYLLFFFQAEDGIRDFHVTGVQTCALPILRPFSWPRSSVASSGFTSCGNHCRLKMAVSRSGSRAANKDRPTIIGMNPRSEERRVGKERRRQNEYYK